MEPPFRDRRAVACTSKARETLSRVRPWRCTQCGALLGLEQNGELHVRYKEVQHWITGRCRHACRRCGTVNTVQTEAPAVGAATEPEVRR